MDLLFVCIGNTCRSPMAEAFVRHLVEQRSLPVRVRSAGLRAGDTIAPEAEIALRSRGVEPVRQDAVQLTEDMVADAVLVLCATEEHRRVLVEAVPDCAGRAFVWGDFVARAANRQASSLDELLTDLAPRRPTSGHDLVDPIGKGQQAYDEAAAVIEGLAISTIDLLRGTLATDPD